MRRTIVSHPSSGRTWLRVVLGKLYSVRNGTSDKDLFRAILKPYQFYHTCPVKLKGKNLFLLRDPKDVLASSYFQFKYRSNKGKPPEFDKFSEFIRCEVGATKIVQNYNTWYDIWVQDHISGVEFYEDMMEDPVGEISDLLDWFEEDYTSMQLDEVLKFSEFENLRRLSKAQYFNSEHFNAVDPDDEKTYKFRVGKIGRGDALIPEEDRDYVEQLFSEIKWSRYHK